MGNPSILSYEIFMNNFPILNFFNFFCRIALCAPAVPVSGASALPERFFSLFYAYICPCMGHSFSQLPCRTVHSKQTVSPVRGAASKSFSAVFRVPEFARFYIRQTAALPCESVIFELFWRFMTDFAPGFLYNVSDYAKNIFSKKRKKGACILKIAVL